MNNISLNHKLEEYNKKYRNRRHRLLKISKKDVEDFDKRHPTGIKGYLLKDCKWWLIDNIYYEIPNPPRYTWFRNLNSAIQVGTCVLAAGVVASAVAVPLILLNQVAEPDVSIEEADKVTWSNKHYDKDGNACLNIKGKDDNEIGSLELNIENYKCIEGVDFTYDASTGELIVKKECIDAHPGKINIKPIFKGGEVLDDDWKLALTYLGTPSKNRNYSISFKITSVRGTEETGKCIYEGYKFLSDNSGKISYNYVDGSLKNQVYCYTSANEWGLSSEGASISIDNNGQFLKLANMKSSFNYIDNKYKATNIEVKMQVMGIEVTFSVDFDIVFDNNKKVENLSAVYHYQGQLYQTIEMNFSNYSTSKIDDYPTLELPSMDCLNLKRTTGPLSSDCCDIYSFNTEKEIPSSGKIVLPNENYNGSGKKGYANVVGTFNDTKCQTYLKSIFLPSKINRIEDEAFKDCNNLTEITFNNTAEKWKDIYKGANWRQNCNSQLKVICSDGSVLEGDNIDGKNYKEKSLAWDEATSSYSCEVTNYTTNRFVFTIPYNNTNHYNRICFYLDNNVFLLTNETSCILVNGEEYFRTSSESPSSGQYYVFNDDIDSYIQLGGEAISTNSTIDVTISSSSSSTLKVVAKNVN